MLTWPFHRCRDPEPEACAASALYTELSPISGGKRLCGEGGTQEGDATLCGGQIE